MDVEQIKLVLPTRVPAVLFWEESIPQASKGFLQKQAISPWYQLQSLPPRQAAAIHYGQELSVILEGSFLYCWLAWRDTGCHSSQRIPHRDNHLTPVTNKERREGKWVRASLFQKYLNVCLYENYQNERMGHKQC